MRKSWIKVVRRDLSPHEVTTIDGLATAIPTLALIDLAVKAPGWEVRSAFLEACRLDLFGREEVDDCFRRASYRRGAKRLKPLLALWVPSLNRVKSVFEGDVLLRLLARRRFEPEVNVKVFGREVDLYWRPAKFGLERIRTLLDALGNPERAYRIVHVAGTNGKGSTSAMIEAALRAAGERTGLYTSPHLVEPTERIRVAGEPVNAEQFAWAFDVVHRKAEDLLSAGAIDLHPTYFETVTAMAFVLFRELGTRRVVLEVGLGGQLDATNVVTPELSVITPIDFDHEQFLGNTIEAIAGEKAGILKAGVPAVFSRQRPEAEQVVIRRARELGCPYRRAEDAPVSNIIVDARGGAFDWNGRTLRCPLAGEHQIDNAITAAMAVDQLAGGFAPLADARGSVTERR